MRHFIAMLMQRVLICDRYYNNTVKYYHIYNHKGNKIAHACN